MSEETLIYSITFAFVFLTILFYLWLGRRKSIKTQVKVELAKEEGRYEPVSLYPRIDPNICIGSGACVRACPEKDILGIVNNKAVAINASNCIGHGACFMACPVDAISLHIGTEKRGVELPHVKPTYETNVPGIYIAGELGGMGLIKNSSEQGIQAVENLAKNRRPNKEGKLDLIIIGAGPAGIAASLTAKEKGLSFLTVDQDSLGGTVFTFPRMKVVMTKPMDIPLLGKLKLVNTSKQELLEIWEKALKENNIQIKEHCKIEKIEKGEENFLLETNKGEILEAQQILLAIGRRGTPRKLGIEGENSEKVAYRLLEPELIENQKIMVVGGGDSAIESALLLADNNEVHLSYRQASFARLKTQNKHNLEKAVNEGKIKLWLNSNLKNITKDEVLLIQNEDQTYHLKNDRVFIFAGGELPNAFLKSMGIEVEMTFGKTVKKHK